MNNQEEKNNGEILNFDRRCYCDFCNMVEICSITHYGTTNYNRVICLECALDIQQRNKNMYSTSIFDLNNSNIRFRNFVYDIKEEKDDEEKGDEEDL